MTTYRELTNQSYELETKITEKLGIDFSGSRYKEYQSVVEALTIAWENKETATYIKKYPFTTTVFSLRELQELAFILDFIQTRYDRLSEESKNQITKKLKIIIRGPLLPSGEDANTNESRNYQFELRVAAKMAEAKFGVELNEHPDVLTTTRGHDYAIECKRVTGESKNATTRNVLNAIQQLGIYSRRRFGRIVAIDVSKLIDLQEAQTSCETGKEANDYILDLLHKRINDTYGNNEAISGLATKNKVVALMFTYSGLYILNNHDMGWVQEIGFMVFNKEHPNKAKVCLKDFDNLKPSETMTG